MTNTTTGFVHGEDVELSGDFTVEGRRILTKIHLSVPVPDHFDAPEAVLEYDNVGDLKGPFKIDPDSVIGPDKLYLLLKNESGKNVTITGTVVPTLPSSLHQGDVRKQDSCLNTK
ncbi:hypothetical protein GQ42DRAFT_157657 [Ramicandelaber brevisporus]|nr:hypothetical protein GQ42DRAFT_157657 [Ramicandelaber brevisporus]